MQLFSNFGAKIQNKHGKIKWDNFGWFSNTVHPVVPFGLLTFPEKSEFCSMSRLEKKISIFVTWEIIIWVDSSLERDKWTRLRHFTNYLANREKQRERKHNLRFPFSTHMHFVIISWLKAWSLVFPSKTPFTQLENNHKNI